MASLHRKCSAVFRTASPHQAPPLRAGPGLGLQFDSVTEEVRGIQVYRGAVQNLGFGVREAGCSRSQGEWRVGEWGHMCRQDHKRTADDICRLACCHTQLGYRCPTVRVPCPGCCCCCCCSCLYGRNETCCPPDVGPAPPTATFQTPFHAFSFCPL